jgi:hypothetical protein
MEDASEGAIGVISVIKEKLPESLVSAAERFSHQHPLLATCLALTIALSILPFVTFVAYAAITLLLVAVFVFMVEGALLAVGLFVLSCAILLSFTVSVGVTAVVAAICILVNLLSSFIARKSTTSKTK